MEQTKVKKRKLTWRILIRITIILAVSMMICSMVGYFFFGRVVKEQKIADEQKKQQQMIHQINFMSEDIDNFTKSVIVDEALQDILDDQKEFHSEYEKVKYADTIAKKLIFYNSLRIYIASSFLELENGERYTSSSNTNNEEYIEEKFSIDEFQTFKANPDWSYSNPYTGVEAQAKSPVISYRTSIWSQKQFGVMRGTYYVEIYLDYFIKQIKSYASNYENVCLYGNDGVILLKQDKDNKISNYIMEKGQLGSGVFKTDGGYLICNDIEETGWKLCTLVSKQYLWSQSNYVFKFFALLFICSLGLILIFTSKVIEKTIQPITLLSERMGRTQYNNIELGEVVQTGDEIQTLYECYQAMIQEIQRGIEERVTIEKQKKEMEFDIMLSQINPHYLYNVLNTIVYLAAAGENKKIVTITNSLIYTLQATLNLGEYQVETTIGKELELTKCYVTIQQYRYPDIFEIKINCENELEEYRIPKTSIQPLVENALLHGILPADRYGIIDVTIGLEKDALVITVKDNGVGISEDRLQSFISCKEIVREKNGRKHIGISNIRDRIQYLYGDSYHMKIHRNLDGGTEVKLILPILKP